MWLVPLSLAALVALVALPSCGPFRTEELGAGTREAGEPLLPGDLELAGLSVFGGDVGEPRLSLAADGARYERRKTGNGIFTYQNFTELRLSDVSAELHPRQPASASESPFDLLGALSTAIGAFAGSDGASGDEVESEAQLLSRVLFDRLTIRIHSAHGGMVSIEADRARGDPDFEALIFEGPTTLVDSVGHTLRAPRAIWLRDRAGVVVPAGHEIDGEVREREAFFAIDHEGALAERFPVPTVSVLDPLLEMEDRLFGGIESAVLRAVLGIPSSFDLWAEGSEPSAEPTL